MSPREVSERDSKNVIMSSRIAPFFQAGGELGARGFRSHNVDS